MQSPCGIEIRVGQVWAYPLRNEFEVLAVGESGVVARILETVEGSRLPLYRFTNKRGGYKLIRDVQGDSNG